MNERIKELAEQCSEWCGNSRGRWEMFDKEKFAKLIVGECARLIDEDLTDIYTSRNYYTELEQVMLFAATADCSTAIKHHFGVE